MEQAPTSRRFHLLIVTCAQSFVCIVFFATSAVWMRFEAIVEGAPHARHIHNSTGIPRNGARTSTARSTASAISFAMPKDFFVGRRDALAEHAVLHAAVNQDV